MKRTTRTLWESDKGDVLLELGKGDMYRIPGAQFTREQLMDLYNAISDAVISSDSDTETQ